MLETNACPDDLPEPGDPIKNTNVGLPLLLLLLSGA
jgi:hypothetical protein